MSSDGTRKPLTDTAAYEAWLKRSDVIPGAHPAPEPTAGTFEAVRA